MNEQAETLLAALRQTGEAGADARAALAYTGDGAVDAERERLRAAVVATLAGSVRPTDLPVARWLLEQEIATHNARGEGAREELYTLVAVVARFAQPSDALLIWRAREATPQTHIGIDVEQLGRLGLTATRAELERVAQQAGKVAAEAQQALYWLDDGAASGAFDDLAGYFLWADERFGLTVSGPT